MKLEKITNMREIESLSPRDIVPVINMGNGIRFKAVVMRNNKRGLLMVGEMANEEYVKISISSPKFSVGIFGGKLSFNSFYYDGQKVEWLEHYDLLIQRYRGALNESD